MLKSYFLSQPHQPFFLLTILSAIVFMLEFFLGYKGILPLAIETRLFHSYTLFFGTFFYAFSGFLFTTFPRFNQTEVIAKNYYVSVASIASLAFVALAFGAVFHFAFLFGMVASLIAQSLMVYKLYAIYSASRLPDKQDSFWILTGNALGLFGNVLYLLYALGVEVLFESAKNISLFLFALFVAFSVAQRMIPFFSHSFAAKNTRFTPTVFGGFVLLSLFSALDIKLFEAVILFVLSIYTAREIKRWQLHPLQSPPILWVLHLALFWLVFGLFLFGVLTTLDLVLEVEFYFAGIHLLVLGFLTTVLIGFGTRVILGHSGSVPHADRVSVSLFVLTQFIIVFRTLYSFDVAFGWEKPFFFDIAATLWLVVFIVWGAKFGRVLIFGKRK